MHYFTLPFLERVAAEFATAGVYHVAHKRIPTADGAFLRCNRLRGANKRRGITPRRFAACV
jgi:hypothetical protein